MLTRRNLDYQFKGLGLLSRLCFVPLFVQNRSIRQQRSKSKSFIWLFFFCLALTHGAFVASKFVRSLVTPSFLIKDHLPIHLFGTLGFLASNVASYYLFAEDVQGTIVLIHYIFSSGNDRENPQDDDDRTYTLQEWLILIFPVLVVTMDLAVWITYIMKPDLSQLWISLLPPHYHGGLVYGGLLLFELFIQCFASCSIAFAMIFQLLFFIKCDNVCTAICRQLRQTDASTPRTRITEAIGSLKNLISAVQIFNSQHANIICGFKICMTTVCINGTYFAIKSNFPLSAFHGMTALCSAVQFCLMYDTAFLLSSKVERVKDEILLSSIRSDETMPHFQYIWRVIRAIPKTGIKLGSFGMMERGSTINFLHFCAHQVVLLLVTFPN